MVCIYGIELPTIMNPIIKNCYYAVRPFLPIEIRWFLQKTAAKRIDGFKTMPIWPLPELTGELEGIIWPGEFQCACLLTHDVETQFGFDHIRDVCEVEKKLGLKSSWNIIPNLYKIDQSTMDYLCESGMEVGVHDWNHDGKLFSDKRLFDERVKKINRKIKEWDVKGFRAGMAFHHDEWMQDIECVYDSSYYDSDPYQPMGGGCSQIAPFKLGELIELPYTMPQDHVLFIAKAEMKISKNCDEMDGQRRKNWKWIKKYINQNNSKTQTDKNCLNGIDIWKMKARWLYENNGMILMVTHPDYLCHPKIVHMNRKGWLKVDDEDILEIRSKGIVKEKWHDSLLEQYAAFLNWFKREFEGKYWHVLPRDMARFWKKMIRDQKSGDRIQEIGGRDQRSKEDGRGTREVRHTDGG